MYVQATLFVIYTFHGARLLCIGKSPRYQENTLASVFTAGKWLGFSNSYYVYSVAAQV